MSERARPTILVVLFLLLCTAGTALGAAELTPEQAIQVRRVSDLQLSPDGSQVAFVVTEPPVGDRQNRDIYVLEVAAKQVHRFTTSPKPDSSPRWSPNGKTLAFLSNREEATQIHLLPLAGGEARALRTGKSGVEEFEWSPDGKRIAFIATEAKTEEEEKREKEKDDAYVVERDEKRPQLGVIEVETGTVKQLTRGRWEVGSPAWLPENRLLVIARDHPDWDLEREKKLYSISADGGQMTVVAHPRHSFGSVWPVFVPPKISPDGQSVAYLGARNDGFDAHDLHLQSLSGGPSRNLTGASIDRAISSFRWRKDGSLLVLAQTGFSTTFYSVSKEGQAHKGATFEVQPGSFVEGADFLAFAGETATRLPELWLSRRGGPAEKVTSFNKEWGAITLVKPEIIRYPSFDGTQIEAALYKPAGYREGTRVPLVVLVHGGPTSRYADRFYDWAQLLAARGFAVITPNIRGSTGYGHEFVLLNRFEWGGGDYKDVMAGVDYLIETGIADPERLGVGGWSYGGFMGAWAVTQTDRFKASVSGAPMTDLASEFGTEDFGTNPLDTWNLGTPYENLDLFVQFSPMTFVKNAKTPTLLLCGEKDTVDPIGQCQQFYRGLKRYGVETEFVVYPREPHELLEEKHRIDVLKRMLGWFEKIRG